MKKLTKTVAVNNSGRLLLFFSLLLLLFFGAMCTNGLDNVGSDNNPSGAGIIFVNINPSTTFGNGSATDSLSQVQVITQQLPDGSTITFQLNSRSLPTSLRGCIIDADTILHDGGQAFAKYLPGIVIVPGGTSTPPPPSTVNIAAIITTPQGVKQQDFGTVILNAVGITPPVADQPITSGSCIPIFVTLQFLTIGIPPGTPVTFTLGNPGLGCLKPTSAKVVGSEASGTVSTEYDMKNNTGGTQVITATLVLPNLFDPIDRPNCPDIPEVDRTIQVVVTITQSAPPPTPAPTPGGTPPACPPPACP